MDRNRCLGPLRVTLLTRLLAPIYKLERVPGGSEHPVAWSDVLQDHSSLPVKRGIDGMVAHTAEPVAGIEGVRFHPMRDRVPVAALARTETLGETMACRPRTNYQKQTAHGSLWMAGSREERLRWRLQNPIDIRRIRCRLGRQAQRRIVTIEKCAHWLTELVAIKDHPELILFFTQAYTGS